VLVQEPLLKDLMVVLVLELVVAQHKMVVVVAVLVLTAVQEQVREQVELAVLAWHHLSRVVLSLVQAEEEAVVVVEQSLVVRAVLAVVEQAQPLGLMVQTAQQISVAVAVAVTHIRQEVRVL
jgi:hypothetical protein